MKETRGRPRVKYSRNSNIRHFNDNWEALHKYEAMRDTIYARDSYRCVHCHYSEWDHYERYGKVLIVHHKDFDPQNNQQANLETVCQPCHSSLLKERNTKLIRDRIMTKQSARMEKKGLRPLHYFCLGKFPRGPKRV